MRAGRLTGIGAQLREAREARGVTFEVAERETHIPRHHLQALEEERFEAFHAPVYVRGFLRSYSQYLKLDSSELLALLPPDRPLEDERLMPVSRLGRPRGPREAARERRDPAARDAAPLTPDALRRSSAAQYRDSREAEWPLRDEAEGLSVVPRLDPLGRLGWPQQPGGSPERDEISKDAAHAELANYAGPTPFSKSSWEQPLNPRRSRHWDVSSRWRGPLPDDTRALFAQGPLLACLAIAGALMVLTVFALALGGGDTSPTVLATQGNGQPAALTIPAASSSVTVRGNMPNVQGTDLPSALATLQGSGVVPVVLGESGGDLSTLSVRSQAPAPGTRLDPQSPVLLVVGSGS